MATLSQHHKRGLERFKRLEFYKAKLAAYGPITEQELEAVLPAWKAEADALIAAWESEIVYEQEDRQ